MLLVIVGLPDNFWKPNVTEVIMLMLASVSAVGFIWMAANRFKRSMWPFGMHYLEPHPNPTRNMPFQDAKSCAVPIGPFCRLVSVKFREGMRLSRFDVRFVKLRRRWYWPFKPIGIDGPFPEVKLSGIQLYHQNRALEEVRFQRKWIESVGGFNCWFQEPLPLITRSNRLAFYIEGEASSRWEGYFAFRSHMREDVEKAAHLKFTVMLPIPHREDGEMRDTAEGSSEAARGSLVGCAQSYFQCSPAPRGFT